MEDFPHQNKQVYRELPFWPNEVVNHNGNADMSPNLEEAGTISSDAVYAGRGTMESIVVDLIMATMPNPERRGYFGPCRDRPAQEGSRRVTGGRNRGVRIEAPPTAVEGASKDPFPAFNPNSDILIGQFVALTVELQEV